LFLQPVPLPWFRHDADTQYSRWNPDFHATNYAAAGWFALRSTREIDKRKARIICETWEQAESLGSAGLLTSQEQLRHVLEQTLERLTGKPIENVTVKAWFERWLKGEKGAVSEGTLKRYTQVVTTFLAFLGTRAEIRLEALSTEDFAKYRDQLLKQGRAPRTVNIIVRKILKRPLTAAVNGGFLSATGRQYSSLQM
jgi:hypothetical protein